MYPNRSATWGSLPRDAHKLIQKKKKKKKWWSTFLYRLVYLITRRFVVLTYMRIYLTIAHKGCALGSSSQHLSLLSRGHAWSISTASVVVTPVALALAGRWR